MGKHKKNKPKKEKKEIVYRTKEQRQQEVREILKQLSKFELTPRYEPVKDLYKQFKQYIDTGDRIEINIPFPMINRRIKGLLAASVNENVWIKLQNEKF
jgi:hypothetical protein